MGKGGKAGGDRTTAAIVYGASTALSWGRALAVPGLQAAANILVLNRQKSIYDDIFREQRSLVDIAIERYCSCIETLVPSIAAAYDDIPDAAEYVPVVPSTIIGGTIRANIENLVDGDQYAACVNRLHEQQAIIRMVALDPRYVQSADLHSRSINDLLRGRLAVSDTMNVMTDVAESAALNGRIGGVAHLTRRSLGISMQEAQREGRKAHRDWMASLNQDVMPVGRQVNLTTLAQTPAEAVNLALTQAQLAQNSLQNVFNQRARKPPARLAELQLRLDKCVNQLSAEMAKVSLTNTFVPNFAAALQPAINAAANKIGGDFASSPSVNESNSNSPASGGDFVKQSGATPSTLVDVNQNGK